MPNQPPSATEYADAIIHLALLARHQTDGGAAAAHILLSAYNAFEWSFSAADIARLDDAGLDAALTVLYGRARLGEPHRFVEVPEGDPERVFLDLWAVWRPAEE